MLSEHVKIRQLTAPAADFANGSPDTAVIGVGNARWATFIINIGVAAGAGDLKPIAKVCAVNAKTNAQSVGGWLRQGTGSAPDTIAAPVRQETGSEVNIAAANCVATQHVLEVNVEEARNVWTTAGYTGTLGLYLTLTETQGDAMVGGVTCILSESRFDGGTLPVTILA